MYISDYIDVALLEKFEFYNYNHALEIITQAFPDEWNEIVDCLRKLNITTDDLREAGGNETKIPKKFDDVLYPYGWREIRISGDLHIKFYPRQAEQRGRFSSVPFEERVEISDQNEINITPPPAEILELLSKLDSNPSLHNKRNT